MDDGAGGGGGGNILMALPVGVKKIRYREIN